MNTPALASTPEAARAALVQQRSAPQPHPAQTSTSNAVPRASDQVELGQQSRSEPAARTAQIQRLIAQSAASSRAQAAQRNPFQSAAAAQRNAASFQPLPLPSPAPGVFSSSSPSGENASGAPIAPSSPAPAPAPDAPGSNPQPLPDQQPQQSFDYTDMKNLLGAFGTREGQDGFNAQYDLNGDSVIDGADLGLLLGNLDQSAPDEQFTQQDIDGLLQAFNAQPGDENFIEQYDLNSDQVIDGADLGLLLGELDSPSEDAGEINSASRVAERLKAFMSALGARRGQEGFQSGFDLNADGAISRHDLARFIQSLGQNG